MACKTLPTLWVPFWAPLEVTSWLWILKTVECTASGTWGIVRSHYSYSYSCNRTWPHQFPCYSAFNTSAMDCKPLLQVLTAINVLSPMHTTYPTTTTNFPNPFVQLWIPTPHSSEAAWRPVSLHSISPAISDHSIPQPYNKTHVRTVIDLPCNELWVDANHIVHVTTIPNGLHQVLFINQVRILEAPAKSICASPPPPYVSHYVDTNITCTATILSVPDNH